MKMAISCVLHKWARTRMPRNGGYQGRENPPLYICGNEAESCQHKRVRSRESDDEQAGPSATREKGREMQQVRRNNNAQGSCKRAAAEAATFPAISGGGAQASGGARHDGFGHDAASK